MPETLKNILTALPFSSGVYIPLAYITGRVNESLVISGFLSVGLSLFLFSFLAYFLWKKGLVQYTGTGA